MPTDQHYKILFVSSELHPFAKTGGLGDVSGSLPKALSALDQDVRILIPAYHFAIQKATQLNYIAQISITPLALAGTSTKIDKISILETLLPSSNARVWMVDCPALYIRPGGPYQNEQGHDWHDNAARFALLNHVAVEIAMGRTRLNWQPDIVHCNDWQTGLVAALLHREAALNRENAKLTVPTDLHPPPHPGYRVYHT